MTDYTHHERTRQVVAAALDMIEAKPDARRLLDTLAAETADDPSVAREVIFGLALGVGLQLEINARTSGIAVRQLLDGYRSTLGALAMTEDGDPL